MNTFILSRTHKRVLQYAGKVLVIEPREIIDEQAHGEVLQTCVANSWLDAKKKFGFPLTPFQQMLLEEAA